MTTFTVWKYDDPEGAKQAASLIKQAEDDQLVKVVDHAVMTWPVGADKPDLEHRFLELAGEPADGAAS